MSGWPMVALGDLMVKKAPSINPAKYPNDSFALYSIPAFDAGHPEMVDGSSIGSAKKIAEPNDVMLSRIVPHIRRACVVKSHDVQHIAVSGEWISFRHSSVHPDYLRHTLVGDPFHAQFMQTVAGVGGSLLRARPEAVSRIEIPLPPLDEQKRIAAILDKADALRRQRRQALTLLDTLTQSIFVEMFGDNESGDEVSLSELIRDGDRINYGVVQPGEADAGGVPLIRGTDLMGGRIDHSRLRTVTESISQKHSKSVLQGDEVLISCVGRIGEIALATQNEAGFNIARQVTRVPLKPNVSNVYIAEYLRTDRIQNYFTAELRTVAQPTLNVKQIKETLVRVPDERQQLNFEKRVAAVKASLQQYAIVSLKYDSLFASLQSRAFSGDL